MCRITINSILRPVVPRSEAEKTPEPLSFEIRTELSPLYHEDILRFIREYYVSVRSETFHDVSMGRIDGAPALAFSTYDRQGAWRIDATVQAGDPVRVRLRPTGDVPPAAMQALREDLVIEVQRFEETVRTTTLYFAWVKGQRIVPERPPTGSSRMAKRTFSGGLLLLQTVLLALNILLFVYLGLVAVIGILAFQLVLIFLAGSLYVRTADWHITKENRTVHLVQYHLPREAVIAYGRSGRDLLAEVKREIYGRTFARGLEPTRGVCADVLSKYGLPVEDARVRLRVIDAYDLVERAAGKFRVPMPKVAISNSMVANAAASGPGPKHGVMILTTGLLIQLEPEEILAVVGHELGHLEGRDPLLLFGLTSAEFLLRLFVLLPLFLFSPLLYLLLAFGVVYFVAKFFETRADLLSAMRIGQPKVLAAALGRSGSTACGRNVSPGIA